MNRAEERRLARESGWKGSKSKMRARTRSQNKESLQEAVSKAVAARPSPEEQAQKEAAFARMRAARHLTEMGFVLPGQP